MLFAAVSIVLMILDHRQRLAEPIRDALALVSYPVYAIVDLPFQLGEIVAEQTASRRALIEENARLKAQQAILEARLLRMDYLEREIIDLRALLQSSYEVTGSVVIAELMRVNLDPYSHLLQVNKGSVDGVFEGQPVLDAKGIMGQIDEVGPLSSVVRLVTDPSHAIPVQVVRSGVRGIAMGTGDLRSLELINVPNNADVVEGDLLVSSGLGGRFPPGYPVGTVTVVDLDPSQPFARIKARPTAELDRSRTVLLVHTASKRGDATRTSAEGGATAP